MFKWIREPPKYSITEIEIEIVTEPYTDGKNCYANFKFTVLDTCLINIGDNVLFGPNCTIATPVHSFRCQERNVKFKEDGTAYDDEYGKPNAIHSNCCIASNVMIAGGVTIGEGCVIGGGSVVTCDISPNSLAAGKSGIRIWIPLFEKESVYYILSVKQMPDKRKKTETIRIHIIMYKVVTIHVTFCSDPFRHGNGIH